MTELPTTLDCQDCGKPVRSLTPEQAREVASRPQDHATACPDCAAADEEEMFR